MPNIFQIIGVILGFGLGFGMCIKEIWESYFPYGIAPVIAKLRNG